MSKFLDKLEGELAHIEQLGASDLNHLRIKAQLYTTWIEKKSKLLPPSSDLLLRAGGSLALLLSYMGSSETVLGKREKLIRQRIKVLDMVDRKSMSRLKGFELFKLYLVLSERLKLLTSQKSENKEKILSLVSTQQHSLVEATVLLADDVLIPAQIATAYKDMQQIHGTELLASVEQIILNKYKQAYML